MTTYNSIYGQPFKHDETKSYNDQINDEVSAMTEFYKGETPNDIPMMPDEIKYQEYRENRRTYKMVQMVLYQLD
ncbi:hypothetical protein ACVPOW_13645 [Staphylococcus aureus]